MPELAILKIGSEIFLLLNSGVDDDGRLINLRYFVSAVPSYKQGGSMIFLKGSDKAIAVAQPPETIFNELHKMSEPHE